MSSFRTLFRAVVMLATLGLLAKAWYHYGPTVSELQAIGDRVAQVANEAWANYWHSQGTNSPVAVDDPPSTMSTPPAPFVPSGGPFEPTRLPATTGVPDHAPPVQLAGNTAPDAAPDRAVPPADPLQAMLERLGQYGACDQQLKPWGGRGELVRFTCRVPWGGSANYTRQFEAVATTPQAAVGQVVAEINAWHAAR